LVQLFVAESDLARLIRAQRLVVFFAWKPTLLEFDRFHGGKQGPREDEESEDGKIFHEGSGVLCLRRSEAEVEGGA
jgi:hypothetical protein